MSARREYLGTGWGFPLRVNTQGGIATRSGEAKIEESIYLILGTAPGERPMLPEFGCGIHDLVFEPNNSLTRSQVVTRVREALVRYEPRIDLLHVQVESSPEQQNILLIRVDYRIRANNAINNMVYPFYLDEGI